MLPFFTTRTLSPDSAVSGGAQLRSAPSPWMRTTWQTPLLPDLASEAASGIRLATKDEAQKVTEVILNSLSMDSAWNDSFVKVEQYLKDAVMRLFHQDEGFCLVIPKGNRFIAASLMDATSESPIHLVSGPVVLTEYHNRGIGSRLLQSSLAALRDRGLSTVRGVTRINTTAGRHLYAKFGGVSETIPFSSAVEVFVESKI
jgi:predicted N-acetyltransferase YhbS